jgi:hypothetical protein
MKSMTSNAGSERIRATRGRTNKTVATSRIMVILGDLRHGVLGLLCAATTAARTALRSVLRTNELLEDSQDIPVTADTLGIQFPAARADTGPGRLLNLFESFGPASDGLHDRRTPDLSAIPNHFI